LPKKQVGGNGGAENGDKSGEEGFIEFNLGNEGVVEGSIPVGVGQNSREDIGKESESEPFEDAGDEAVGAKYDKENDDEGKEKRKKDGGNLGKDELDRGGHGGKISADIDGIGGNYSAGHDKEKPFGVMAAYDASQAVLGN